MSSQQLTCEICKRPLGLIGRTSPNGDNVCQASECRFLNSQRTQLPANQFEFQRKIVERRAAEADEMRQYIFEVEERERTENAEVHLKVIEYRPEIEDAPLHVMSLPSAPSGLSHPTAARIENYENHLWKSIESARNYESLAEVPRETAHRDAEFVMADEQEFEHHPELRQISDAFCGICRGGCCPAGKDTAFISAYSMRKFMDRHPDLTDEQIFAEFFSRRPEQTVPNSCINHGPRGCGLPREMRAETCNGFYCEDVVGYRRSLEDRDGTVTAALVVQRGYNWNRFSRDADREIVSVNLVQIEPGQNVAVQPLENVR